MTSPAEMTQDAAARQPPPSEALWRAMPVSRLLDCGMEYGDVLAMEQATAAGELWDVAAERLADAHLARAELAEREGRRVTAVENYRGAVSCFVFAQMAFNFDVGRKRALYARHTDAASRLGRLSEPQWERLELPFDSGRLFGWLVTPAGPVMGTVIVFGGQSGWSTAYLRHADALNVRSIAVLLAEGPGQGETRMDGGLLLNVDVRAAYSRFVDHLAARPHLGRGIGLWGNSLGGLYAGTTAASDARVDGVCINGAPAHPRLLAFRTFAEQAAAMLGTNTPDAIQRNFDRLALRPQDRLACPLLVLHGGADPIVSLEEQQPFLDAASHDDVMLRVWDDGEHTIYNHAEERTAFVADWFADRFAALGPDTNKERQ
ncbi:alpha/beta hydrolase [Modestobacter excelsi]|uniref:alpha/beta hydrolase n=1 Tax=Modestobacter excelsi TaxID=2213161 RepID=UPI001C20E2ED|nr:alpha/beta hydrolase [Modestobacter excelsi]